MRSYIENALDSGRAIKWRDVVNYQRGDAQLNTFKFIKLDDEFEMELEY